MHATRTLALPFATLLLLGISSVAFPDPAAPPPEWCGADELLRLRLEADPSLQGKLDTFEALMRTVEGTALSPTATQSPLYIIPVAVHIVHQNGAENISDAQVQCQIDALNRDFQDLLNSAFPAVDTRITFCLAQNVPSGSTVVWSTTAGITRTVSAQTNHTYGNSASEAALKAIDYLPSDRYLNIWVVKSIAGGSGGVVGYGTFPGMGSPTLDGIVMRSDVFGTNYMTGCGPFNLLPGNSDGKVLPHEVGHYLNLYHPFQGGCSGNGDFVSDTPPTANPNTGCPSAAVYSCSNAPDPIENFMNYTNDACRFAFTQGQSSRMAAAIITYRSLLVSPANLVTTGCSSGLQALISATPTQTCTGQCVQWSTPASGTGYTYAWTFPGGTPSTSTTQSQQVCYGAPGVYGVSLTVTDNASNTSTNIVSQMVYVSNCSPIAGHCAQWYFGNKAGLTWASGLPAPLLGGQNSGIEAAAVECDASGNLLFYSDAVSVWNKNHTVMPNGSGLLGGSSSHNGVLVVPVPGSGSRYFLFTVSQQENGPVTFPVRYSVIDMTLDSGLGDIVSGQKNLPVNLPGSPDWMLEGQTAIPHCNGTDWWYITAGAKHPSSSINSIGKLYVTLVTSAGPTTSTVYSNMACPVSGQTLASIAAAHDGSKFAMSTYTNGGLGVYTFDAASGVPGTFLGPTFGGYYADVCFSPNGELVYVSTFTGSTWGLKQIKLKTLETRILISNDVVQDMELGPDDKLYIVKPGSQFLSCINFPDAFNTQSANECGLNLWSVSLGGKTGQSGLPNTRCGLPPVQPAKFTYTVSNCTTVTFHAVNCSGPYAWTFGDAGIASGRDPVHFYAGSGEYVVNLNVTGASPPDTSVVITLGLAAPSLAGPADACRTPSNYSVNAEAGLLYAWTILGGTPAAGSGNNVDVIWGNTGGSVILTVTDPTTGCVAMDTLFVEGCDLCVKAPLGIRAWWPLDETSGIFAYEILAGNDGLYGNSPSPQPGKVLGSLYFNGFNSYVVVNDEGRLDLGLGNLTVDAWVRTENATSGIQSIVDKRAFGPEQGYALYLKNARLALRLAGGNTAAPVEYWAVSSAGLADYQWHHVAATVDRNDQSTGVRLYVDGQAVAVFGTYPAAGDLDNGAKLLIGAGAPASGPNNIMNGSVDEVEIFARALGAGEVHTLWQAGSFGKCKEYCHVPWDHTLCLNDNDVTVTLNICNASATPHTYNLSFQGLSSGSSGGGGGCTYNGPTIFQVVSPTPPVAVAPQGCTPVQVKITKPPGMTIGSVACYQVTITNVQTGNSFGCRGSIERLDVACPGLVSESLTDVPPGSTTTLRFFVKSTLPAPQSIDYEIEAMASDMDATEPVALSLNGLPPGAPAAGSLSLAPGESTTVSVLASFTLPRPFRPYDVLLKWDMNGDGDKDAVASAGVRWVDHVTPGSTSVPDTTTRLHVLAFHSAAPNPFRDVTRIDYELAQDGPVRVELYSVTGRRLRTVDLGLREAGRNTLTVDSGGLASGVYFVRVQAGGGVFSQRVVVLK